MEIINDTNQLSKEFTNNNNSDDVPKSSPIPIKRNTLEQTLSSSPNSTSASSSPNSTFSSSPNGSQWTPDIFKIISSLTNWLKGIEENKVSEEEYKLKEIELWNDWEWILSTTEEFLIKQNKTDNSKILNELDTLKKAASNLKVKPFFTERAVKELKKDKFTKEELSLLKSSPLDPNKRLGVITTVINTFEEQWLEFIKQTFFSDEIESNNNSLDSIDNNINNINNDSNNSGEKCFNKFENDIMVESEKKKDESVDEGWEDNLNNSTSGTNKNINIEETKEVRKWDSFTSDMVVFKKNINKITWDQFLENFKGSKYSKGVHGRMKDLGWQASHGVDGSLNSRVMGDITWSIWNTLQSAVKQIRDLTLEEPNDLIDKNSRIGVKNEGIVVEKWKQEETKKKKKIMEMKKSGLLDKYNPEKVKILDHERKEISQIRSNLEKKLKLRK
ncbi:hypothetical protein DICPUDRAFT_160503 [Dictyostelium purpureum]|uniref:Uncharacterized protein n=1 Tax=Dictyostelium purpureum TaxID=5786 RepID=F1A6F0_DICPU|nr:uncharacterized protein DICPUDRAFT_160503 [Dictyostelium purpureum]EGC28230.1 hypothetical protein DICPUDRAFT_160503 [Dictyostelium purpureum]|eukprot:XP_003295244.1 hypothetical protein DICPUDRAFT_160503 [Dictyostelium purpureum]